MANTYTQIYVQIVFAVEARQCLIRAKFKEELHKYITGITTYRGQKLLAIHCMPDHAHLFIGQKPSIALSDLVHDVKKASTTFINQKRGLGTFFLAGRIRRVLVFPFANSAGGPLYSKSGAAPCQNDLSR